jgi:hypothetical protein
MSSAGRASAALLDAEQAPPHANPRALSRLIAAPLLSRPPEAGALPLRETRGKEAPFPFPPGASRGGESSPHADNTGRLPPQEGFQNAPLKTPLRDPPVAMTESRYNQKQCERLNRKRMFFL